MPSTKSATENTGVSASAAAPAKTTQPETAAVYESAPQLAAELSIESIGWLFLQKYYASYTADIHKLYAFYDSEAALLHEAFPATNSGAESSKTRAVHVAHGSESVRAFYEAQGGEIEKNKIVVESAAFQQSVDGSILIVVAGAWKRGTSQLYHFSQTFVLRAKGKTVYDIANDVLAFVDVAAEHKETVTTVNVVENPVESTEATVPEEKTESVPVSAPAPAPVTAEPETAPDAVSEAPASVPAVETPGSSGEDTGAVETNEVKEPVEAKTEESVPVVPVAPAAPAAPAVPAQKPTWANLAAIGPKTTQIASKTVVASSPAAAAAAVAVAPGLAAKKAASPSQPAQQATANGKYKKEEWYPIYIKNVEIEEEELKAALVKQFGEIKFFKRTNKTALCDFRNKEDQQRALEQREMVIKNNVILLEPRLHKTFNGKPDAKKDKKHVKKPVNGNANANGFKK